MSAQYYCPNCRARLTRTALTCTSCGASFDEGSAWRPEVLREAASAGPRAASPALAAFAIAASCATVFPLGARLVMSLSGGMYGPVFKKYSPALFLAVSYLVNYVPLAIIVWVLLKHFKVMERVPRKYHATGFFSFGLALLLLYVVARVLAATVPGGGAGFVVANLGIFVVVPALALLIIGVVRFIYGLGKGAR